MPISVNCSECNKSYNLRDDLAGKKIRCRACKAVISIPRTVANENSDEDEDFGDEQFPLNSLPATQSASKQTGTNSRKHQKKRKRKSSNQFPVTLIACMTIGVLLLTGVGVGVYFLIQKKEATTTEKKETVTEKGKGIADAHMQTQKKINKHFTEVIAALESVDDTKSAVAMANELGRLVNELDELRKVYRGLPSIMDFTPDEVLLFDEKIAAEIDQTGQLVGRFWVTVDKVTRQYPKLDIFLDATTRYRQSVDGLRRDIKATNDTDNAKLKQREK